MKRSGPVPFAYERVGGRLVAHANEATVRQRVFELFVEHKKKSVVASELNHEGQRTRTGSIFSAQSVGRILQDDIVLGNATIEQIVDASLCKQYQAILSEKTAKGGAKRAPRHLLAGLLHCQLYGEKMYGPSLSRKYFCRSCRLKIGRRDIGNPNRPNRNRHQQTNHLPHL